LAFLGVAKYLKFDIPGLRELVSGMRDRTSYSTTLRLFRDPQTQKGYRPVVKLVDKRENGSIRVEFLLINLPDTFPISFSKSFDVAAQLFYLASQFRWRVSEAHAWRLEGRLPADPQERRTMLRNLVRSVEEVLGEASALRMDEENKEQVLEVFDKNDRERLENVGSIWDSLYPRLQREAEAEDAPAVRNTLTAMRLLNAEVLRIALKNLNAAMQAFEKRLPSMQGLPDELLAPLIKAGIVVQSNVPAQSPDTNSSYGNAPTTGVRHTSGGGARAEPPPEPRGDWNDDSARQRAEQIKAPPGAGPSDAGWNGAVADAPRLDAKDDSPGDKVRKIAVPARSKRNPSKKPTESQKHREPLRSEADGKTTHKDPTKKSLRSTGRKSSPRNGKK
jgi:hypothetical protein